MIALLVEMHMLATTMPADVERNTMTGRNEETVRWNSDISARLNEAVDKTE